MDMYIDICLIVIIIASLLLIIILEMLILNNSKFIMVELGRVASLWGN